MDRWPQSVPIFLHHHMVCVGCPMASFCTLEDVVNAYHLDIDSFLSELEQAIRQPHLNQGEIP
ncbi:MAG TPA: hypothetical protein G4N94_10010 [Caldilineae bacterium]|nr:hypothetical protein [Caldilineae bacterium]